MNRPVKPGKALFVAMVLILCASTAVTYFFGLRILHARAQSVVHLDAITWLERVLSTLKDAETGQRGFLLTDDKQYLEPYTAALSRLPEELKAVAQVNDAHIPEKDLEILNSLAASELAELKRTIDLRRQQGLDAAEALLRNGTGRETMDAIRAHTARLEKEQQAKFLWDIRAADQATRIRSVLFGAVGALNIGFIAWAYRRIARAFQTQQLALSQALSEHSEAERQRQLLSVTLSSIGDCVIVTDADARVTFMNEVAEKLTGWSFSGAHLRPTAEVFRIVNEETREPVESPVEKVMKNGVIVGLANHTLLICKDGREVPIDDSGAPIRDPDGSTRGVVLVFRDFSEHKAAEAKLNEAKEAAETANKAKDHFLAMLSHELRTPLTPVLATLDLWEASEELPQAMRADLRMLQRNLELEARIIDDLLDLTRIARGMLSFSPADTNIHELLEFLLGLCQSEFQGRRLNVTTRFEATDYYVHTDASRLQQVIWNILTNASKFTEPTGEITVSTANDENGRINITINDSGIGMTPETLEKIFVPFEQGGQHTNRRYGGLGLGMAISRALIELLGGEISATSDGPGRGSSFTVSFPTIEAPPPREQSVREKALASDTSDQVRILLVEDHPDTARALARLLARRGYQVELADSVAAAIDRMQSANFDLLLSDIGLPDGTGIELVEKIRTVSRIPALALSGFGMEEDINRCKKAGFDAHLTKPVNFQKLDALILQLTRGERRS